MIIKWIQVSCIFQVWENFQNVLLLCSYFDDNNEKSLFDLKHFNEVNSLNLIAKFK